MADPFTVAQVANLTKEEVGALLALNSDIAMKSANLSKAIDRLGWDLLQPGFAGPNRKKAVVQNVPLMDSLVTKLGQETVQKVLTNDFSGKKVAAPVPTTTTTAPSNLTGLTPAAQKAAVDAGGNPDVYTSTVSPTTAATGVYNRPATLSNEDIQYAFDPLGGNLDLAGLAAVAAGERVKQWRAKNPGVAESAMPTDLRAIENPMGVRLYYDRQPQSTDTFGGPMGPSGFVGHGRVDKMAPYAQNISGATNTKSIRETLALLNTKSPAEVKAMQQHLVAGGFLDPTAVKQNAVAWGDPNDVHTRDAWRRLISASMGDRTRSMMQILQESEQALAPHLADYLDPNSGGGTSVTIALTDPAAVRVMSNQLSQNLIGRKLDEVEQAQLVQQIHDMELKQGMGRAGKGTKVVNQVDAQAELTEAIRAKHPDEAGAADVANEFTMFNRLVKGTLPSEGGF